MINNSIQEFEQKISKSSVLFFDMDGTLVDTNYANYLAYKKAIEEITKSGTAVLYDSVKRFNRSELIRIMPDLFKDDIEKIILLKEEYYKNFLQEIKLNGLIVEILLKNYKKNKTVLVTNCQENRAIQTLNYCKLFDKFSHVFYRSNNGREKINKYKNALIKLQLAPSSVLVFENEKSEVYDAILAGIPDENILSL